jgi:hypothetical protein
MKETIKKLIGIFIIIASFAIYLTVKYSRDVGFNHPMQLLSLWNYKVFLFVLGATIGLIILVYGFSKPCQLIINLFKKSKDLKVDVLEEYIRGIDFMINSTLGIGRVGMIIAFINLFTTNRIFMATIYKIHIILFILMAYLYALCLIYLIYNPIRQIFVNRLKKIENA